MAHTHEVPNHLNVEDTLFLGLTSRQVATFIAFASPAYGLYDQLTVAPMVVRGRTCGAGPDDRDCLHLHPTRWQASG